jgi:hypothetical protein
MVGESVLFADGLNLFEFSKIPTGSATLIRGVFDADQGGQGTVVKVRRIYGGLDLYRGHHTSVAVDEFTGYAAVKAHSPTLVIVDVGIFVADQLVPRVRMQLDGRLVGHCSAGEEQGGFLTEHFRNFLLEGIYGRVGLEDIVAHLGGHHGVQHAGCGLGYGIAYKIYFHDKFKLVGAQNFVPLLIRTLNLTHPSARKKYIPKKRNPIFNGNVKFKGIIAEFPF